MWSVLVLLLASMHAGAFEPIVDVPYEEIVSQRYTLASATPIYNWGQLPFDDVVQVVAANLSSSISGAYVLSSQSIIFIETNSEFTMYSVSLGSIVLEPGCRIGVLQGSGLLAAVATPTTAYEVACTASNTSVSCAVISGESAAFGVVNDLIAVSGSGSSIVIYVASMSGGYMYLPGKSLLLLQAEAPTAVAYYAPKALLAFGSNESLMLYVNNTLTRRDWATDIVTGSGGVYDAPITSLVFDVYGWLFVGTQSCVDILFPNNTVNHLSRFQGLPFNQTTSVSIEYNTQNLWVGTTQGAARWERTTSTWRYFYLQRYLPGQSIISSLDSSNPNFTIVATDGGIAFLESQMWTLAQKADYMEVVQARHNRLGLSGDCFLDAFGNIPSCLNHDNDNNGLWTSLVVAAEAFRYAVTGDPDALNKSITYFEGMHLLNTITGITGLMARSYLPPGQPITSGGTWHNATIPGYEGWIWKGDTSSDEVTGHMFAYSIFAKIMNGSETEYGQQALQLISNIVHYIVANDFYLIDITGQPTSWGAWNPSIINWDRLWSDDRGVNSLQILSWIASVQNNTGDPTGFYEDAYLELTNATNQYNQNLVNLKIETVYDDNYSDDELTFLPYYTYLTNCQDPVKRAFVQLSMERTFNYLRPLRSDLWNAIYGVLGGAGFTQEDMESMIWNLQTWPLEQVDWPTDNTLRQDIFLDPTEPGEALTVVPANERTQGRWNGDPYDLVGGSGYNEMDPGAWMLPYWMARYYGLIV